MGQVYENKGIVEKAVAEYEKFVRIHETGAMVDEAKTRIAKIKNISEEEVERLLNSKKQDAPMASEGAPKTSAPAPVSTASSAAPAAAADPGGVKLTDPKEYLRQVLAKAKAAKNPQAATPEPAASPKASASPSPATPKSAETPPTAKPSVAAASTAPIEKNEPKAETPGISVPPVAKAEPVDFSTISKPPVIPTPPPVPEPVSASEPALTAETAVVEETPALEAPETAAVHYQEEPDSSIPVYLPDQPLPASALDGYVLDEEEVINAIAQVDTQSVEQESQVLEAVEAISSPAAHHAEDEILEDGAEPLSSSISMPSLNPSKKNSVKHGFY